MIHVSDVRSRTFSKPDEYAPFSFDVSRAKASATPVAPRLAPHGLEPSRWRKRSDTRKSLLCDVLLEYDLGVVAHVLQCAAAASAEELARRLDPHGCVPLDRERLDVVFAAAPSLMQRNHDLFTRQCTSDEELSPVYVSNAFALVCKVDDRCRRCSVNPHVPLRAMLAETR
jgi:hypothetical protein